MNILSKKTLYKKNFLFITYLKILIYNKIFGIIYLIPLKNQFPQLVIMFLAISKDLFTHG